jgi:hypothetical protein
MTGDTEGKSNLPEEPKSANLKGNMLVFNTQDSLQ